MLSKVRAILKNSSIRYTLMSISASAINYITILIYGRIFGVEEYGVINAFQSLIASFGAFVTPLQLSLCRILAEKKGREKENKIITLLIVINAIEIIVLILFGKEFVQYLGLSTYVSYVFFVVAILFSNNYIIGNGIAQGKQNFYLLGAANIAFYGVKAIMSICLSMTRLSSSSVLIGIIAGAFISIFLVCIKNRECIADMLYNFKWAISREEIIHYIWMLLLYLVVSLYLNNGDVLLGKFYASDKELGLYSVAMSLAKMCIYLIATPIATVLLPKLSEFSEKTSAQKKILLISEVITLTITLVYSILFCLLGEWFINLLYGSEYEGATVYLLPTAVFSVVTSLFYVFYQYAMVTGLFKCFSIVSFALSVGAVVLILFFQCEMSLIPIIMAVVEITAIVLSMIIYNKIQANKNRKNVN